MILLLIPVFVFSLLQWEQKPDPASEKISRQIAARRLNKDPNDLTDEDFAKITALSIRNQELSDIRLLKKFKNPGISSQRKQEMHIKLLKKDKVNKNKLRIL